ncbi:hypothetical protein HRbin33_01503 [bacterium HR33]|nr:hypothetical protein HRbin33_01503 [bacterium HR33]
MTGEEKKFLGTSTAGIMAMVLLVPACQAPTAGLDSSWFRAQIRGAVQTEYEGTGWFNVGSDPRRGISVQFTLYSSGVGTYTGQRFQLYSPGKGRPGQGIYGLAPLEVKDGSLQGFTAYYHRVAGERSESYTAVSGRVNVAKSSGNRVEGDFDFTGVLYCWSNTSGTPEGWCTSPNTITPGAPQIQVTGSFSVVAFRPGAIVEEGKVGWR